jgi:hypothetical protein
VIVHTRANPSAARDAMFFNQPIRAPTGGRAHVVPVSSSPLAARRPGLLGCEAKPSVRVLTSRRAPRKIFNRPRRTDSSSPHGRLEVARCPGFSEGPCAIRGVPRDAAISAGPWSYGSQRPKFPGHDDDSRAKNRRDDFVLWERHRHAVPDAVARRPRRRRPGDQIVSRVRALRRAQLLRRSRESRGERALFGHERGAFSDAREKKLGLVEVADGDSVPGRDRRSGALPRK